MVTKRKPLPDTGMYITGVSFNMDDPDQKKLAIHAYQRTNFSAYVKRLIQRDMDGVAVVRSSNNSVIEVEETLPDPDMMRSLI